MSDPSPAATGPPIRSTLHPSNLNFLRKQAKVLLRVYHAGDPVAAARIGATCPHLRGKWDGVPRPDVGLLEAQFTLARELGYKSWPKLKSDLQRRDGLSSARNAS